jgi:flagellar protein FlgJ
MNSVNFTTSYNLSLTSGNQSLQNAKDMGDISRFNDLVKSAQAAAEEQKVNMSSVSSSQVKDGSKLNGDYTQGFSGLYKTEADKHSAPIGAAANGANLHAPKTEIDRTSKLYEQALQLENYFVKIMLSSMRNTVQKAGGEQSYAQSMYEDMMYDQYSETLTKNAGFGLADQIYTELAQK